MFQYIFKSNQFGVYLSTCCFNLKAKVLVVASKIKTIFYFFLFKCDHTYLYTCCIRLLKSIFPYFFFSLYIPGN